ncbi:MAG: ATPase, partial [Corynebacterium casei]|nr:ATPase [Corynebacterium casei]
AESGEHPGYQEFTKRIMPRTEVAGASESSEPSEPSEAPASRTSDIEGLHIPAGFEGSFNNFPLGEDS